MYDLYCVDAFSAHAGAGNPAGVCLLSEEKDPVWMQMVAREMNLSETAFLLPADEGYNLRWFTPLAEVDLCGHATLAAAHILWQEKHLKPTQAARFFTISGTLTAVKKENWIEMDFPEEQDQPSPAPPGLIRALGVQPLYVGRNRFDYLIEVGSEQEVRDMQPDFALLSAVPMRGVMVTSAADSNNYDFVSRFFAPSVGINEDPVTGSAHCCLAPYWQRKLNKKEFLAYQASARGGVIRVNICGNNRVILAGRAVSVWSGILNV